MRRIRPFPLVAAIFLSLAFTSCSERGTPVEPAVPESSALPGGLTGTVTDVGGSLLGATTGLVTGVLACPSSETYTTSQVVGRDGGTIKVGPHTLLIPPRALSGDVEITATAPAGSVTTLRFEPHGLRFERPTALTMSYAHCGLISGLTKRVVYVDGELRILEVLPSVNDLFRRRVTGKLDHFSAYAVAE
ncbi:MAG TPA: hypothetical protein VMM18_06520 [Gemmatimonadaceae bacterium]|nr:hypothetical protein [Gemmatimonadaceae bacterium]